MPDEKKPYIRLRPPGRESGPEVYWKLNNVEWPAGTVGLTLADLEILPVKPPTAGTIQGRVLAPNGEGTEAALRFVSVELTGECEERPPAIRR